MTRAHAQPKKRLCPAAAPDEHPPRATRDPGQNITRPSGGRNQIGGFGLGARRFNGDFSPHSFRVLITHGPPPGEQHDRRPEANPAHGFNPRVMTGTLLLNACGLEQGQGNLIRTGEAMANKLSRRARARFKIMCAWCGRLIRRDPIEDGLGMCLDCYHRELSRYLRTHKEPNVLAASDR